VVLAYLRCCSDIFEGEVITPATYPKRKFIETYDNPIFVLCFWC